MENSAFPLSVETNFVEILSGLSRVPGAIDVVTLAATAQSEMQARFITDAVAMLARYNSRSPLASISAKDTVVACNRNGAVVVPSPG